MKSRPMTKRNFTSVTSSVRSFLDDPDNLRSVDEPLRRELARREVYFGDGILPSFPIPDLMSAERERDTASVVERFTALLETVGNTILESAPLRAAVGLAPDTEPLLEIDPGYERLIVISRLDMSCASTWKVFEANTDSPAMMTFTDHLEEILMSTPLAGVLGVELERLRRTRSMLDGVLACYKEWGGTRDDPTIAIVDWPGEMTASELRHTAAAFTELGCPAVVCGPADLSITDGKVHAKGRQIDIIQRRVLFPDFIKRAGELEVFTEAYRRSLVCVVNPLRSITIGNKAILGLLSERTEEFDLDDEQVELVHQLLPETFRVTSDNCDRLLADREGWVLKRSLGSGGKAVTLGVSVSDEQWRDQVNASVGAVTVAQRKQDITRFPVPVLVDGRVESRELYSNWNPWVFGGRYASGSTRVSEEKVCSISAGGGLLPSFSV